MYHRPHRRRRQLGRLRPVAAVVAALATATLLAPAAQGQDHPPAPLGEYVVAREPGIFPEGIAVQDDGTMYVSSDGTGRLYRGSISEPVLTPFEADGTQARGRSDGVHTSADGRVWSVGGSELTVHDRDGRLLATRTAAGGPLTGPYLNDLVITPTAVYVTDWYNPVVYRAEVHGNEIGPLQPWLDVSSVAPWFPKQFWYLNGIVADPGGHTLLVASNGTEATWRVDTSTRAVEEVDLGGQSFGPDGMAVSGNTLYAVLNYGAPAGVYVADLADDWRSGRVRSVITHDAGGVPFDVPTTLAVLRCRIYVVDSQLNTVDAAPPFTVSAVPDPTC